MGRASRKVKVIILLIYGLLQITGNANGLGLPVASRKGLLCSLAGIFAGSLSRKQNSLTCRGPVIAKGNYQD